MTGDKFCRGADDRDEGRGDSPLHPSRTFTMQTDTSLLRRSMLQVILDTLQVYKRVRTRYEFLCPSQLSTRYRRFGGRIGFWMKAQHFMSMPKMGT